jgi:gamma-glutamylcyclotransferase (GGCT)/AIG2-like uncharacterized protein YtfP
MKSPSEPELVFVYGSLMSGFELNHLMNGGALVGDGRTRGILVSLGTYPGMIDGEGTVRGELYRFDDMPAALDVLDDVEEFDATDPGASAYLRVARPVMLDDGRETSAWVYVYNRPTTGAARITTGDWRLPTERV